MENKKKSNTKDEKVFSNLDEKISTGNSNGETNPIEIVKPDKSSQNIADIVETPDVSSWNKEIKGKEEFSYSNRDGNTAREVINEKTAPLLTLGLRVEENENEREMFVDPANEEEMETINSSGKTVTDKFSPFTKSKSISKETEISKINDQE